MKKIITKAKRLKDDYDKPTPIKWRRIGDSILTAGTTITAISAYTGMNKYVIIAGAILTGIGKIVTNFAK